MTHQARKGHCPTCAQEGRAGVCARFRCYCGHPECWAYDSWVPINRPATNPTH